MNLKYAGILTAFAVSAVMAQNATPAETVVPTGPASAVAPVADVAPAQVAPAAQVVPVQTAPVQTAPVQTVPVQTVPAVEQAAPVQTVPAQAEDKFTAAEQELAPEKLFAEPSAVRGADAAKPVSKTTTKKFVYRPVYSPAEIETSGSPVKTIYVSEVTHGDSIDMDQLRGLIPMKFTFGFQGFIGTSFLSGDNGRYEYDRYYGLTWSAGAFAMFPLDEYNMGLKAGVMFEHAKVSNSYVESYKEMYGEFRFSFSQYRISLPILLSLKSARSNMYFDVGVQPSFATADEFKLKHSKEQNVGGKLDMLKNDYRQPVDWSIVFGFGIRANRYLGFDARFNWGLNNQYDDFDGWAVNNLSSKSFTVGATFYAF